MAVIYSWAENILMGIGTFFAVRHIVTREDLKSCLLWGAAFILLFLFIQHFLIYWIVRFLVWGILIMLAVSVLCAAGNK